ncbi:MAG: glycine/sarcosine/betaine reductase selenoprotein B family protein [Candidatus Poribacteria bacterium]|nr:glycine/sarcosine/betaine reductase selenoprotein B family protein [Candidatus Poribacteria bacterium]
MASFDELDFKLRAFMKFYRYRRYDSTPHAPLQRPLASCRVALVTTAGLHTLAQEPFDDHFKGGDYSYREIPNTVDVQTLTIAHRSTAYDQSGGEADRNLVFPLDRFRELEQEGKIGALNDRHFSFMGSQTAPGRLIKRTAPEVAQHLKADSVDVVFLTPV